jgi:hypothetical protein
MKAKLILLCGALALVVGCDRGETENGGAPANEAATAEGKAEDGRVTVKAPGVDISVNIPESVRSRMATRGNSELLPPGAQLGGIHVQGGGQEGGSGGDGTVELSFRSDQSPEQLAAWYRDPARGPNFTISSETREGAAFVLGGTTRGEGRRGNGGRFTVRISPRQGGSDGRLLLSDRR